MIDQRAILRATLLLCLAAAPFCALAEDEKDQSNLGRINRQVEEQKSQLKEISLKQAETEKNFAKQQGEVSKMRERESLLVAEIKINEGSRQKAETDIKKGQERLVSLKDLSMRRLRAIYMHNSGELLEVLLSHREGVSVAQNALYLGRLRDFDRKLVGEISGLLKEAASQKTELEDLAKKKNQLVSALSLQRQTVEKKVKGLESLNRELKSQKDRIAEGLTALKAQALRLETVVVSLTGGEDEHPAGKLKAEARESLPAPDSGPFKGDGLYHEKGALALPVQGKVLKSYGKQKTEEFEDMIFNKGIEYRTDTGADVHAIAAGRVMHVGRMPGYGTIVIVDHGERYYSLYGRLGETLVTVGKLVGKGDAIAKTGEQDAKSRNFYFEIRRNGSPVNPQDYYKRL